MQKVDVEIKKDRIYAVVIILAVVILTFMRSAYSPIYRYVFCPDSICYRIMTRGLLAGRIPYRDLFDHKGPLSYFIYAIGLLISGGRTWGMCLISCVINAISFLFVYKTARIRYCREVSLLGIAFVLFMCSLTNRSPLNTLNAPDDFLLLPLMVSAYLIFKEVASQKEGFDHLSRKTMFITGIMCGAVLWIKLNVCLFYFAFIGCYFLWLIIKRRFKAFLENTAIFLGGIAAMTVVALAFYAVTGTLGNLWESYISFNLFYSSVRDAYWIFDKVLITFITKVSVSLMLLICALAFLLGLLTKRLTRQHIVTSILLLINYLVLTYFAVYDYFYIVFFPLFLAGICELSDIIRNEAKKKGHFTFYISLMFVTLLFMNNIYLLYTEPREPWTKDETEIKIEEYAKTHKDAQVLFASSICRPIYSDYIDTLPNHRLFYLPNTYTTELLLEHYTPVKDREVDIVVIGITGEPQVDDPCISLIERSGYRLYQTYSDAEYGNETRMYVLE